MRNAGLEETQAGIKIARRNINNLRYADDTNLMVESEDELKSLLMKVKEESEKVGLICAQAWKPSSQQAVEKRGVAGMLLGRTERAARAAELQLCAQAR